MDVVKELALMTDWFGHAPGFKIDIDSFDLGIPMRALVPNCQLDDPATTFKLAWRKGKIDVLLDPEDGLPESQYLLSSIKEKCEKKNTIGSTIKVAFSELCGEILPPASVPLNPSTPDYLLRAKKTVTPSSYDTSSSGSGKAIYYTRFDEEYEALDVLGGGSSAEVQRVLHKLTGIEQAIKVFILVEGNEELVLNEVKIMARLQHPHIVRYYDAWTQQEFNRPDPLSLKTKVARAVYMSMEYCPRTLSQELKRRRNEQREFSTQELEDMFRGFALGLSYIHKENIVHRDLSMDNVFLDKEGVIKIGDFGLAETKKESSEKIDLLAFGKIMYELLNPLTDKSKVLGALSRASTGGVLADLTSSPLRKAIASLIHEDPMERLIQFI